ncbi:hypothetical protein IFO70_18985 [Phormidium tenue FACHB-886]|nr:hypothetical protein [Phormidium tenue FACHB-886]
MSEPTQERVEEPIPAGDAYAIVTYRGINGKPTTKAKAYSAEVIKYGEGDKPIALTTLDLTSQGEDDD